MLRAGSHLPQVTALSFLSPGPFALEGCFCCPKPHGLGAGPHGALCPLFPVTAQQEGQTHQWPRLSLGSPWTPQSRLSGGPLPQEERGDEWCCLVFGSVIHPLSKYLPLVGGNGLHIRTDPQSPLIAAAALTRRKLNQEMQTLFCFFETLRNF